MAINHYRISPKFWPKARSRGWSDQQINLALYLLTCKHRNLEGLYVLPKPYIAADLGWPAKRVDELLATLIADGFAEYDDVAQVVLIPKALKHQSPTTDNQVKGAIVQLKAIPRTCLWHAFRMACASHCPRLADAIEETWPSHADGVSHAHAGSPADATSSISRTRTTPPQPPEQARGEQDQEVAAGAGELPANSRAHGTNPRALAKTAKIGEADERAHRAASALVSPGDEHIEAWDRVRQQIRAACNDTSWGIHLSPICLVGVAGTKLVVDAPDDVWAWVSGRFATLIERCAEAQGVPLRLATKDEHAGMLSGVAA